jgi:hypothetical protein
MVSGISKPSVTTQNWFRGNFMDRIVKFLIEMSFEGNTTLRLLLEWATCTVALMLEYVPCFAKINIMHVFDKIKPYV